MKLTFIGATHEVTGSCTYIEIANQHYLVDFGMRQGRETYEFCELPVKPSQIDGVFLTHAHIDHSGMLPKLYKDGFRGAVYSTEATEELCEIMLKDSAHIQEMEAEWKNRKLLRSGGVLIEPVYTMEHAQLVCEHFKSFKYNELIKLNDNVSFYFNDIGHLLGSSSITLILTENGITKKVVFSGDVGNFNHPIICDPKPVEGCDYLLIESTYGNRLHQDRHTENPYTELASFLQRAFDRGGNVVIPSFAVGRTQEILYLLREIKEKNLVSGHSGFPVYLDSPLAVQATNVFNNAHRSFFDEYMLKLLDSGINPLMNNDLKFSVSTEESKMINFVEGPKVIISSSGMCEAGRIRHHLKHNLWNPNSLILFVGYQAEGSLGRAILDGKMSVRIFGEEVACKAEICHMHGTSGHADKNGLLNWIDQMNIKPKAIFVNHGSHSSCEDFASTLNEIGYFAFAPHSGSTFDLESGVANLTNGVIAEQTSFNPTTKHEQLMAELLSEVARLERFAKSLKGKENRQITKLKNQIKQLLDRF